MATKIIEDGIEALEVSKVKDGLGLAQQQEVPAQTVVEDQDDRFTMCVLKRKAERGRPTNKRDKASNEGLSKRPRFCKICRSDKHTSQKCPDRDPSTKKPRKPPTCSGCGVEGHSVDRCHAHPQDLEMIGNSETCLCDVV